jgi:hypothetical protein
MFQISTPLPACDHPTHHDDIDNPHPVAAPAAAGPTPEALTSQDLRSRSTGDGIAHPWPPDVRLSILTDVLIWSWSTNTTDNMLIWLRGAHDFHHSVRHHRRSGPWTTIRVLDHTCNGAPPDAYDTADAILDLLGAY